jgi:hypothetical protein
MGFSHTLLISLLFGEDESFRWPGENNTTW